MKTPGKSGKQMKNLVKNSESVLLTVVTLCAMYFLGTFLVGMFQSLVALGQDETMGFLASTLPIAAIATVKGEIKKLPFTASEAMTANGKNAFLIQFEDLNAKIDFEILALTATGMKPFAWPSKKGEFAYAMGLMKNQASTTLLDNYNKMTVKTAKEVRAKFEAQKVADREAKKADKATKKGSAKGSASNVVEQVAKLDIALERGLITKEVHTEKLNTILGI